MKREEALEKVRQMSLPKETREILEALIPELTESEDERIVDGFRTLLNGIRRDGGLTLNKVPLDKCFAWLEKQKESLHTQETCKENSDSFIDSVIEVRSFQRGLTEGRRQEQEKQKEQKSADDKAFEEWIDDWWKHNKVNNPDSYDKGDEIQFDERGFKNFCRGIRNMYQQKPARVE